MAQEAEIAEAIKPDRHSSKSEFTKGSAISAWCGTDAMSKDGMKKDGMNK